MYKTIQISKNQEMINSSLNNFNFNPNEESTLVSVKGEYFNVNLDNT